MTTTDTPTVTEQLGLKPVPPRSAREAQQSLVTAAVIGLMVGTGLLGSSLFLLLRLCMAEMGKQDQMMISIFVAGFFSAGMLATIMATGLYAVSLKKALG